MKKIIVILYAIRAIKVAMAITVIIALVSYSNEQEDISDLPSVIDQTTSANFLLQGAKENSNEHFEKSSAIAWSYFDK